MPLDLDKMNSLLDEQQKAAAGNTIGTQDVSPDLAAQAIEDEKITGVPASVGMYQSKGMDVTPGVGTIPNPHVVTFAQDPARAAAVRDDHKSLGEIADKVMGIPVLGDFLQPGVGSAVDFYHTAHTALATDLQFEKDHPILSLLPGALPSFRGAAADALGVATAIPSGAFNALYIQPGAHLADLLPTPAGMTKEQQHKANEEAFALSVWGLGPKGMRRGPIDLGTAHIVPEEAAPPGTPQLTGPKEEIPFAEPPAPGVEPSGDAGYAAHAEAAANHLQELEEAVTESKTFSRSPAVMEEFVNQVAPDETVSVNPDAVTQLWGEGHEVFTDRMQEVAHAEATGQNVDIPLATYLKEVAGQPFADQLREHSSLDDGVSQEEAKSFAPQEQAADETQARIGDETWATSEVEPQLAEVAKAAVQRAIKENYLSPLFRDASALNMSESTMQLYANRLESAMRAVHQNMVKHVQAGLKKDRTVEWKERFPQNLAKVEEEFFARPDLQAAFYLQHGEHPNGAKIETPFKLNRGMLRSAIGVARTEALPQRYMTNDGIDPQVIAETFGYDSADEMALDLERLQLALDHTGLPLKQFVKQLANAQARNITFADLGFDTSPDGLLAAAKEAVTVPEVTDLLINELEELGKQIGFPINKQAIEDFAERDFAALPLKRALNIRKMELAVLRSARKAEEALLKNKPIEAFRAKQQQLLSHYQLIQAHQLSKDFSRAQKRWGTWAKNSTLANIDQEWLNWIHFTLKQLGFNVARNAEELVNATQGKSLSQFVEEKRGQGYEVLYADLPQQDLTAADFQAINAMLKNFAKIGANEKQVDLAGKKEELDQLIADVNGNFDKLGRGNTLTKLRERGPRGVARRMSQGANAWMIQPERLLEAADGDVLNGPLVLSVDRPMQEAMVWKQDTLKDLGKQLEEFMAAQPKDWVKSLKTEITSGLEFDGEPLVRDRGELIRFALNAGNQGNFEKLLRGYSLSPEQAQSVLARMTKADWDFVQKIWDMHESLWPKIESEYRELVGIAPAKVKALPIETEYGTYRGGYYPISYDWLMAEKLGMPVPRKTDGDNPFGREYVSAFPANPYTEGRTNFYAPILLNFDTVLGGLNATVHDLAFRRALLQANRIINHPQVKKGVIENFGPEYLKQLQSWLKYVAHESLMDEGHATWVANFLRNARVNVSNVGLMYRFSVVALHGPAALISTLAEAEKLPFLNAMKDLYFHPGAGDLHDFITENSGEIRHRMRNTDRDINDAVRDLVLKQGFLTEYQKYGYHLLGWSDQFSARGAWLYQYRKGLGELIPHEEAAKQADQFVRQVHGSGSPVNLAGVQRGGLGPHGEIGKFATLFTGFLNHTYNRNWRYGRLAARAVKEAKAGEWDGARRDFSKAVAFALIGIGGVAWWYQEAKGVIQGSKRGTFEAGLLHNLLGGVPVVNAALTYLEHEDLDNVILQPLKSMVGTGKQPGTIRDIIEAAEGKFGKVSPRWVQHAMETAGYWSGLGLGGPGLTAQFLWNWTTGKEKVDSFPQFIHGLLYGPAPKGSHKSELKVYTGG